MTRYASYTAMLGVVAWGTGVAALPVACGRASMNAGAGGSVGVGGSTGNGGAGGTSLGGSGGTAGAGGCCGMGGMYNYCTAGGESYSSGSTNPDKPCERCLASYSAYKMEWQPVLDADQVGCGSSGLCRGGTCKEGCTIDGIVYTSGAGNPARPCEQSCQPSQSTTAWSDAPPARCITAISAGSGRTCAIVDGNVYCWGSLIPKPTPAPVPGLPSGATAVSVSLDDSHTCAIAKGVAYCWGLNSEGQLGNGTTTDSDTPVRVGGLAGEVQAISAGRDHTCAVVNGAAYCWGGNGMYQSGDDAEPRRPVPGQVSGVPSRVRAIAAGSYFSCAVVDGGVYCWGSNSSGEFGTGTAIPDSSKVPTQVPGLPSGVQSISTGISHACAAVAGAAYCWGLSYHGALGSSSAPAVCDSVAGLCPVLQVDGFTSGVTVVATSLGHTCAVVSGGAWCWGDASSGALGGNPTHNPTGAPLQVRGLGRGVQAISAGYDHTCALAADGVWCWGGDYANQYPVPVQLP